MNCILEVRPGIIEGSETFNTYNIQLRNVMSHSSCPHMEFA